MVLFIQEVNHADVVLKGHDVRFGKGFHRWHVRSSCFESAETVLGEADGVELRLVSCVRGNGDDWLGGQYLEVGFEKKVGCMIETPFPGLLNWRSGNTRISMSSNDLD